MKTLQFIVLLAAFLVAGSFAQNADPLVYTVGNSYRTTKVTAHNYLLWQPGDITTTYGKRFAVYEKPGDAASPQPYVRLSIQTVQTSPSAIQALLKLGEKFDHDASALPRRITTLHADAQSQPLPMGTTMPTAINLEVSRKLAQIMTTASTDPEILQSLISLGRAHPGVMMAMGHGFAIEVPGTSTRTYEVREIGANNTDLRVIGRVTLRASAPFTLPPPGRPFPNPHPVDPDLQLVASPKDHLNVRLRWGMSDALRNALPQAYGFNLYRVPKGFGDPDTLTTAEQALAVTDAVRVNDLPIAAGELFTDAEAANLDVKRDVFFYADDKNPPSDPFVDGETFFYYVAARDIAGHPGPLSPPTAITLCDRLPPSQPAILSVDNVFDFDSANPSAQTGKQHLRVVIRQVPELPVENSARKYRVYRWHSATDWQRHGGDPEFNCIGEVDHVPGETTVFFDDDDSSDLDTDYVSPTNNGPDTGAAVANGESDFNMGKTFWYTVRAVDDVSCDPPNLSGHSGAHYGVLRDRVGPEKPTGEISRCFCRPLIENGPISPAPRERYGLDPEFVGTVMRVNRTDPADRNRVFQKIRSFEVQVGQFSDQGLFNLLFSRVKYYDGLSPFGEVIIPVRESKELTIRVRVRLDDRTASQWASFPYAENPDIKDFLQLYQADGFVSKICRPVDGVPGATPLPHYPVAEGGAITGVSGLVFVTAGSREVRVYRRVGKTAPLQMIFKTAGDSLPPEVPWEESAPVVTNGVEVCYFAQLFDEHGNGSPLVRIGCLSIVNDDFAIPLLSTPEPQAPLGGQGILEIPWFCDPVGIDRFEVWVASETGTEPVFTSPELSGKLETGSNPVLTTPEGDDLTFCIYQTPRLVNGFGNGAEFRVTLQVPYGQKYYYAIRPVGEMIPDEGGDFSRAEGEFSNLVSSAYAEPSTAAQPVIPWPARPLPGSASINQPVSSYTQAEGPFYATAIAPELMRFEGCSGAILVGALPSPLGVQIDKDNIGYAPPGGLPSSWLFQYRKQAGGSPTEQTESILRFVVYRHQVISSRFPDARPNLVQVTPLIDRMTFYEDKASGVLIVDDPFFLFKPFTARGGGSFLVPDQGTFSRNPATFTRSDAATSAVANPYLQFPDIYDLEKAFEGNTIWVKDTLPVTRGASYQYLIVHFTPRGEIARVIPTNVISH